ncbi:MAG: TniQ family protein [Rhodospirillaceae bacterium]|nr:TniQ family protein [Rhodospirillales bacterium]
MIPTLLHRPQPFQDENLSGYLLRVAELNGFATPKWISELASLRRKFAIVRQDMRPMAELLGIDVAELERRCYWPADWAGDRQMHLFSGEAIHVRALNLGRPRICPDCLKASPHIRQSWDLALSAVCSEHRCILLDACPECGSALSWNRSAVCLCHHCGHDLRDAEAPTADPDAVDLMVLLHRQAGLGKGKAPQGVPAEIAELPLAALTKVILLVGATAKNLNSIAGHWPCARLNATEMADLVQKAAKTFKGWPSAFHHMLTQARKWRAEGAGMGLEHDFRGLYRAIYKDFRAAHFDFLRQAFEDYVTSQWDGGVLGSKNTRLADGSRQSRLFTTRGAVARILGARPETVDQLVASDKLKAVVLPAGKRRFTLIARDSVANFRAEEEGLVDMETLASMLGISKAPAAAFARTGLLKPVMLHSIGRPRARFRRTEIADLLQRLEGKAPHHGSLQGHMPLSAVLRVLSSQGLGLAALLAEVIEGRMAVAGVLAEERGLHRLLFDSTAVKAFVDLRRVRRQDGLTIPQAALRLKLKEQVAYQLVRAGLWETIIVQENGRPITLVPTKALNDFEGAFVSAVTLALRLKTSPRHLTRLLQEEGVHPVTGPTVDGGRQTFFRTADVSTVSIFPGNAVERELKRAS